VSNRKKKNKSKAEFEALVMPLMSSLYGMALRMTRDDERARDLVQDSCLKAYRSFHQYERGTNFRAWIFRILTNTYITQYHRRKKQVATASDLESRYHYERFVGQGSCRSARDTEAEVLDHMMSDDISTALQELPEEFRLAVMLCDIEGFSYREIAEILKCPVGTVMSRLYRGRRLLQNLLYQHAVEKGIVSPPPEQTDEAERPRGERASGGADVARIEDYRKSRGKT
jgi:RNA polymerase sigma-70 factor (ECF subfamily)